MNTGIANLKCHRSLKLGSCEIGENVKNDTERHSRDNSIAAGFTLALFTSDSEQVGGILSLKTDIKHSAADVNHLAAE